MSLTYAAKSRKYLRRHNNGGRLLPHDPQIINDIPPICKFFYGLLPQKFTLVTWFQYFQFFPCLLYWISFELMQLKFFLMDVEIISCEMKCSLVVDIDSCRLFISVCFLHLYLVRQMLRTCDPSTKWSFLWHEADFLVCLFIDN